MPHYYLRKLDSLDFTCIGDPKKVEKAKKLRSEIDDLLSDSEGRNTRKLLGKKIRKLNTILERLENEISFRKESRTASFKRRNKPKGYRHGQIGHRRRKVKGLV